MILNYWSFLILFRRSTIWNFERRSQMQQPTTLFTWYFLFKLQLQPLIFFIQKYVSTVAIQISYKYSTFPLHERSKCQLNNRVAGGRYFCAGHKIRVCTARARSRFFQRCLCACARDRRTASKSLRLLVPRHHVWRHRSSHGLLPCRHRALRKRDIFDFPGQIYTHVHSNKANSP